MGTGSCGEACKNLGINNFIGCEIDEYYFNIAKERLNYE
jgi:DNA modification methylase